MLELKDFHFSLWLVVTAMNEVSKWPQQSPRGGVMEQTNWAV